MRFALRRAFFYFHMEEVNIQLVASRIAANAEPKDIDAKGGE